MVDKKACVTNLELTAKNTIPAGEFSRNGAERSAHLERSLGCVSVGPSNHL